MGRTPIGGRVGRARYCGGDAGGCGAAGVAATGNRGDIGRAGGDWGDGGRGGDGSSFSATSSQANTSDGREDVCLGGVCHKGGHGDEGGEGRGEDASHHPLVLTASRLK